MDLIALSEELSIADLAEIFARKLLAQEQEVCKARLSSMEFDDDEKDEIRNVLASTDGLSGQAQDFAFECWFHRGEFADAVDDACERFAEEYTRDL